MDIDHVWCNLKPDVSDIEFVEGVRGCALYRDFPDETRMRGQEKF